MLNTFFSRITRAVGSLIYFLFGKISWHTPPWFKHLRERAKINPKQFWFKTLLGLILLLSALLSYRWYLSLPQPERLVAKITVPPLTPISKILMPENLQIDFGILVEGEFNPRSVAPLSQVQKEVTQGISIDPAIEGKWFWVNDSHLLFKPASDWIAGQTYHIHFDRDFFSPSTQLASRDATFTTLPFQPTIAALKFYQDPINPKIRQIVATISFSFAVDPISLEKHIQLHWQAGLNGSGDPIKYTLTYDEHKRTAYLTSEPLPLSQTERYVALSIATGLKPLIGSTTSNSEVKANLLIPDIANYFKVSDINTSIIRNTQDRPEQILNIETTLGVKEDELTKSVHAYLLPKDYPATAYEPAKPNYQWQDPGAITPAILALATSLDLHAMPADHDYATLHSYIYHAATPSYIYVTVNKGTRGFGDFALANAYAAILKVPAYPKEISLLHKGAILALGTEEKLSVLVRGLAAVKFTIARILPDDVNHLVTQTGGEFSHPYFTNYQFNQTNISEIFSQIQTFDASDPAKEQYTALNLSQYLSNTDKGPRGLFLLKGEGWDKATNTGVGAETNRLVLITDLGLIIKDNNDGTHDVFVQSINKGSPINQAVVTLLGKNGIPIIKRKTDQLGHAHLPSTKDFTDAEEPTVYLVKNGNDVSFMPYSRYDRQLNYSRYDIGGLTNQHENQASLTAFLFTERGIYRPGDIAHIAMIVKQPFILPESAGLPLEATIVDPRGVTVKREKISLDETGFFTLDFQTLDTSQTGKYLINLFIVKDNHSGSLIGSTSIQVAEFLPDRMRIATHLSESSSQGWISPNGLMAKVNLMNLYGAPAANHRVSGKMLLTPKVVTFKEFPNYIFVDPLFNPKSPPRVFSDNLDSTRTNEKGEAEFDLKLNRFEKATYQLTVFSEGFEAEGGRSVASETSALVSPLTYLVGYHSDGDLNYIKQQSARYVNFIAVNPQLKQQALANLKIQISQLHPITTLVKKEDGTYQYQSIVQTSVLNSNSFAIAANGTQFKMPTDQVGDFMAILLDEQGTELSHFKFSIVGNSHQPLPKNAELNVKLNQREFHAGDEIEMQINAPYAGAGLITIERDKVYQFKWFKTDTTASIQTIRIPNDFQGDGYVNIAFVRDLNSPEILMSPLSYHVQPFSVTHQNHAIKVQLTVPAKVKPGETLPITYTTDRPSKIIVFGVDEGILQVSKYASPDPLAYFFQKHALEVNTQQIVDQILPKFIADRELSTIGGDAGEAALRKNLNPFKRKTDAPVVFWSGILDSDASTHQFNYPVPNYFNGTLHVMAVAVAADAVGASSANTEIRGDFIINPNVPTFVAPGDEFDVSASVANNVKDAGQAAMISIDINTTPALQVIGTNQQSLVIPEGQERSLHFKLRAKAVLSSAEIKWTTRLHDKSSFFTSTVSVRPASSFLSTITSGYTTEPNKTLPLDRLLYPEYRKVEVNISTNPLILVAGLENYLNDYPYGCTEQLVSKAFPLLAMSNQPWFNPDTKIIHNKIQHLIEMLEQRQTASGGFSYWPETGSTTINDFASVYAMHFMTEARIQGLVIPTQLFSSGVSYLKELIAREVTTLDEARLNAYAIYILTRNEIITSNYLTHLQLTLENNKTIHWKQDITSAYMASTYQLLKSSSEAEKMIAYYQPQAKALVNSDFYNQSIGNAQYLYLVAHHFPEHLQQLNNIVASLVAALNTDFMSTTLSAYASMALGAYQPADIAPSDMPLTIKETLNHHQENVLSFSNGPYQKSTVTQGATHITLQNPKKHAYFYQLTQAGFDQILPKKVTQQGIEVYRELHNAEDKLANTAQLGEEMIVHLRARAVDNQYHTNVAIVDLLPGGFEVVRESLPTKTMDYIDAREDRVNFFGEVGPDSLEITYRIKATNMGTFSVPPLFAMAMYHPLVKSLGVVDKVSVTGRED